MLSVPCQALLYFPTVNKDKQTDGHHQSGCKDKTFWLLLHFLTKIFLLSLKNISARRHKKAFLGRFA